MPFEEGNFHFFMEIFAIGIFSDSDKVVKLACLLIESIES
jgi:hypothetical protein